MTHHTLILTLTNEQIQELVDLAAGTTSEDLFNRMVRQAHVQEVSKLGAFETTVDRLRNWLTSFPPQTQVTINSKPVHFTVVNNSIELHS